MSRKADATRRRLLDAALAEFARYGIAGARVDRIAAAAGSNKAQIYHYFGSKDRLFDAVFEELVTSAVRDIPIEVTDLPGYAARLAQGYEQNPAVMRLVTWQRLERAGDTPIPVAVDSIRAKVDAIAKAQADGILPARFAPGILLGLVLHLAAAWSAATPEFAAAVDLPPAGDRPALVAEAVRQLLA